MSRVIVDDRYAGDHGIARYAREVVSRLPAEFTRHTGGPMPSSPGDALATWRLRLGREDIVYSPGFSCGLSPARQLITIHDLIHLRSDPEPLRVLYYNQVVRRVSRRAGTVLTVSESSRTAIIDWLDDPAVEVVNCGNGCSEVFSPHGELAPADRPFVLMVGNEKSHKNTMLAYRALALLPDFDLLVVTSDPGTARRRAHEAGLHDRVTIRSGIADEELASIYRAAAVLAFPSVLEGFGLPVVESLMCGTPVVHLRSCVAAAEICGNSQFPVDEPYDATNFATAIELASAAPFVRPDAMDTYRWSSVAARVETVIRNQTGRRDS